MNHLKGFAAVTTLLIVLGILVLGGVGYIVLNPGMLQAPAGGGSEHASSQSEAGEHTEEDHVAEAKTSIAWRFTGAEEVQGIPYTAVTVLVNGAPHEMGRFAGSCSEISASGGIDSKGLLAGELSAAQCWFAGGGNEIGVFAHEDGGFDLMVGELSEGEEGAGMFRGDFGIKSTIAP